MIALILFLSLAVGQLATFTLTSDDVALVTQDSLHARLFFNGNGTFVSQTTQPSGLELLINLTIANDFFMSWTCASSGEADLCPQASGTGSFSQRVLNFNNPSSVTYDVVVTTNLIIPAGELRNIDTFAINPPPQLSASAVYKYVPLFGTSAETLAFVDLGRSTLTRSSAHQRCVPTVPVALACDSDLACKRHAAGNCTEPKDDEFLCIPSA